VLASLSAILREVDYSFEDTPRKTNSNDKCVGLRTRAQLHPKECPFLTILESVDRLIAHSLIIEHDLRMRREVNEKQKTLMGEMLVYLLEKVKNMRTILSQK
jgi:hypothetical protein